MTGVQTCALPISEGGEGRAPAGVDRAEGGEGRKLSLMESLKD